MVVNIRKKATRMRAKTTHGYGSMKKNRGAGNRGGRGNAGSGKRADSKKPSNWSKRYFGKKGFTSKSRTSHKAINVGFIDRHVKQLAANKKIVEENGTYVVDLNVLGYAKLLSSGAVYNKLRIVVNAATEKAIEKVSKVGGKVIVPGVEKSAPVEEPKTDAS